MKQKSILLFAGLISLLLFAVSSAKAQNSHQENSSGEKQHPEKQIDWIQSNSPNIHEFNLWAGYASNSFQLWGKTPEATLSQLGIRYNRKFLHIYNSTLEYILEISLYTRYTYPEFTADRNTNSISGGGFSPAGFQLNFLSNRRLQPFLKTAGGFMFLSEPFPDSRGRKFNFTFDAGGGFEYMITQNASVTLGYRYYHLSNGETGQVNPGIDSSFFYVGITFF